MKGALSGNELIEDYQILRQWVGSGILTLCRRMKQLLTQIEYSLFIEKLKLQSLCPLADVDPREKINKSVANWLKRLTIRKYIMYFTPQMNERCEIGMDCKA